MNVHICGTDSVSACSTVWQAFFRLHLKTSAKFLANLEAELLRAGVHRGRLAHTRRSCNENGVAQQLPSITLRLSLALEVSTVPHICTPAKLEVFQPKERHMGIFMKTIIVKLKCCLFRLPKVKKNIPLPSSRFFSSCVLLSSQTALCFHLFNQLNKNKDKTDIIEKDKVCCCFFTEFKAKLLVEVYGRVTFAVFSQRQRCWWLHLNAEGCICQSRDCPPKWHLENKSTKLGFLQFYRLNITR